MSTPSPTSTSSIPVSLRAGLIGLILSAVVSFWGQYAADHLGYNYMTYAQMPSALLLPFLVLIMGPYLVLKATAPRHAFTLSELIVIFAMGLIGSMVPDWGMTRYLVAVITAPHYFAGPENQWAEKFFDTLPSWLVLTDTEAVRMFFEGRGAGQAIPWGAWLAPLVWWLSCIAALMWSGACLVVILRKQWVEYERLRFPLGEVAMNLMQTESVSGDPASAPMTRTPLFRIGLFLGLGATIWNIGSYWNLVAPIPIMGPDVFELQFAPSFPGLPIRLNIFTLCFAFFVNAEILLRIWFFLLLTTLQRGFMNMFGLTAATTMTPTGLVGTQSVGAMIAFVLWGLWMARRHIAEVIRKARGKSSILNDDDELFSYRAAVIGLGLGLLYLVFWLNTIGISLPVILLFLAALFIFYLAMARMVAEAGLVTLDLPVNANVFTAGMVGAADLTPSTITGLCMTNAFARNWRTFTMIGLSHVAWLQRRIWPDRQHLFRWICLSFGVSVAVSLVYIIYAGYTVGADNMRTDPSGLGQFFYNMIGQWQGAASVAGLEITFFLIGIALYMLMMLARYVFFWWPLHPIGLVAVASDSMRFVFLPFFLAWLIQTILIRFGGGGLYRKAQPLFLGLLVGYVLGMGLSYLVDTLWFLDAPHSFESFLGG